MEDSKIVALYLRRSEDAIKQSAEKYGSRLRALSYRIVADRQTAEECENDTYMEAWSSIPPHEPRTHLFAFLARITRHLSLNCCRDRSRLKRSAYLCELSAELEQCIPSSEDVQHRVEGLALGEELNRFLGALSEEKRDIFVRRYWYLDSVAAISGRFAISESKVKTVLFRCRERLRKQLETEGYTL